MLATPNTGRDVEQQVLSGTAAGNAKWYNHIGRQLFLIKVNIFFPYNPVTALPAIYTKELKPHAHTKT